MRPASDPEQEWYTIVGVVSDEYNDVDDEDPEMAYGVLSQSSETARFLSIALRTQGDPMAISQEVRSAVMAADPNLPIYWVRPMTDYVTERTWPYTVFGSLMIIAGLAALFLACVGLYGVMAFSVTRRTREIGVRMALGARPGRLRGMVLRQGGIQMGIGAAIGIGLAILLGQAMQLLLFGVEPTDPVVLGLIVTVLAATGVLACGIPARRATRVDPVRALNEE